MVKINCGGVVMEGSPPNGTKERGAGNIKKNIIKLEK
jgi:hypothetical protein